MRASLALFAVYSAFVPIFALKCDGVIDTPKVIEEDIDFSASFCTLRDVTVKGSVIGRNGAALVTEGQVAILGSVVLSTEAGAILGGNLDIRGELDVQGPIGKGAFNGVDKVVVGNKATINKVVIRFSAFVTLNGSDVGSVEMKSGARGLRTIGGKVKNGGILLLNQKGGIIDLQGTDVLGPVLISEAQGFAFSALPGQFTRTILQGGLTVKQSSGTIRASETRFRRSKLEVLDFNGLLRMVDIGIPETIIERLNGTITLFAGLESSMKILDSVGEVLIDTASSSKGPVEIKNSRFTGSISLDGVLGPVAVTENQGFYLRIYKNTGGVLVEKNTLEYLRCSLNVPAPILVGNAVSRGACGQCTVPKQPRCTDSNRK